MTAPDFRRRLTRLYADLDPETRRAMTAKARATYIRQLEHQVDPDGVLDDTERARQVSDLRRANISKSMIRSRRAREGDNPAAPPRPDAAAGQVNEDAAPNNARLQWQFRVGYYIPNAGYRSVVVADRHEAHRIARFVSKHWGAIEVEIEARCRWVGPWTTTDEDGAA